MGSSSSKYLDTTSRTDYADVVKRISDLVPGQGAEKDLPPKPDSQLKSTRESVSGKVWGHNLLSDSKESGVNQPVGHPPYHDDQEEVIEVYTEEILPIDEPAVKKDERPTQTVSLQDVPTMDLPPCPPKHKPRSQEAKLGNIKVDPSAEGALPPKSPKQAFVDAKAKKKARSPLRNIEDIRQQQHERIMEQMRMYEARVQPTRPLQVTKSDNCTDPGNAYDVMKELKREDETLEQVAMKTVASEGGKKSSLKGKPQAWTQSAKSSNDSRNRLSIAAVVSATLARAGKTERGSSAKRAETQRASSASGPEDTKIAHPPRGGNVQGINSVEKTILDLDIL